LAALGVAVVLATSAWAFWSRSNPPANTTALDSIDSADATSSGLLTRASAALAAGRLTEPVGDNALEFYLRELARNPRSEAAHAGIADLRERLYARAQSALLEERLDAAAIAIAIARRAGVESGRIALLSAELAKARAQKEERRAAVAGR
jgi:protein TonB